MVLLVLLALLKAFETCEDGVPDLDDEDTVLFAPELLPENDTALWSSLAAAADDLNDLLLLALDTLEIWSKEPFPAAGGTSRSFWCIRYFLLPAVDAQEVGTARC